MPGNHAMTPLSRHVFEHPATPIAPLTVLCRSGARGTGLPTGRLLTGRVALHSSPCEFGVHG